MNTLTPPPLVVYDPYSGGHHAEYVAHLLRSWQAAPRPCPLVLAVPPGFTNQQQALFTDLIDGDRVRLAPLPVDEPERGDLMTLHAYNKALLSELIEMHRPAHIVTMYLDHLQLGLATGLRFRRPITLSGILFRPSFHYAGALSFRDRLRGLRQRLLWTAASRNPHLATVYSLDTTAVAPLRRLGIDAVPLPDPVNPTAAVESPEQVRRRFGVDAERTLLLAFGVLDARKGIPQLLEAVERLPEATQHRTALLLAGPLDASLRPVVAALRDHSAVQILVHDTFVPEAEIQPLIGAADLVLATYDRHVGSSAVLIRAAAAQRPVLSQDYGFMGALARQHGLGRTVATNDAEGLTDAIEDAIASPKAGFDAERAAAFAASNTPPAFAETLLRHIVPELEARSV